MAFDLSNPLILAGALIVLFIVIRVVLKITHTLLTLGCLAVIALAVLAAVFGWPLGG
jgi:hypothetical protein